jgi:hypothetical protein
MGARLEVPGSRVPVQGGASFDMSNVVEEFIKKPKQ